MAALDAAFADAATRAWPSRRRSFARRYGDRHRARRVRSGRPHAQRSARVIDADTATVDRALGDARRAQPRGTRAAAPRAPAILERAADVIERERDAFVALLAREAGKTRARRDRRSARGGRFLPLLRAAGAARTSARRVPLPSPTGESNTLSLHGRGVFACISPVELPAGDLRRPGRRRARRRQRGRRQARRADAAHRRARGRDACIEAGVPGGRARVAARAPARSSAPRWSRDRAHRRRRVHRLDRRRRADRAHARRARAARAADRRDRRPERDDRRQLRAARAGRRPMRSSRRSTAPASAARRCACCACSRTSRRASIELLVGAMDELVIGDPARLGDRRRPGDRRGGARCAGEPRRGDAGARASLRHRRRAAGGVRARHVRRADARRARSPRPADARGLRPGAARRRRCDAGELDALVDAINAPGYGLTLGIHSRIDATIDRIVARARVGNLYVNRNMIGAVVGVQPFGGEGLSGTGPKAGGPHYLFRFAVERTLHRQHRRRGRQRRAARARPLTTGQYAGVEPQRAVAVRSRGWQRLRPLDRPPSSRTPGSGASLRDAHAAPTARRTPRATTVCAMLSAKRSSSGCGLSAASALMRSTTAA